MNRSAMCPMRAEVLYELEVGQYCTANLPCSLWPFVPLLFHISSGDLSYLT